MFNITIAAIGKIKEKYFAQAATEYLKRLKPYIKIDVRELKPEPFKRESDKERAKKLEAERILKFLEKHPSSRVIVLDERGQGFNSLELAEFLKKQGGHLIFVIGGALGLDKQILKRGSATLSLSPLTLPHELARVVLLEQIYRAVTILKNKSYHY